MIVHDIDNDNDNDNEDFSERDVTNPQLGKLVGLIMGAIEQEPAWQGRHQ